MTDIQRRTIKLALEQCIRENENKATPTFYIDISAICKSAIERINELERQVEKMKCCSNCDNGLRNGLLCEKQKECRINNYKLWELAE